ncbi:MAG: metallophosphoesterase, partial [Pseudomonadota bacterium]
TLCGVLVETDDATGLATRISGVRVGGQLQENVPDWA